MDLPSIGAELGVKALLGSINSLKKHLSKKQQKKVISSLVCELLKLHPDLDGTEAKILALEATGEPPSPELIRAKAMLVRVKKYKPARKKATRKRTARTKPSKRKAAKREVARKRVAKKKTAKKK